jgi:regulator of replication initiation timing
MKKGLSKEERKNQLLTVMHELHQAAQNQGDFTAEKVAERSGVSKVLLYRYSGAEFKELRAQLPGSRRTINETISGLRLENAKLQQELREARTKLRMTAVKELDEAILLIEALEEQNIQLRSENKLLRKRLSEGGQVIVQTSSHGSGRPQLTVISTTDPPHE